MRLAAVLATAALAGCQVVLDTPTAGGPPPESDPAPRVAASQAANQFVNVVRRVEPVAEQVCRERRPSSDCDLQIYVDDRPGQPPNAFQTLDRAGRPIIVFTLALIAGARNEDELAFVLGHEAAHHIAAHIPQTQQSAAEGALLGGLVATLGGFDAQSVDTISRIGASVGARRFSKDFELEADALGTRIAARAGYDPVRGAEYFNRIPDPGDQFLGTHPPNAERMATVRRTAARL